MTSKTVPSGSVVLEGVKKTSKSKCGSDWVGCRFRVALTTPLQQLASMSHDINEKGDTKPFKLGSGFGAADDFETLSLAEVLLDLGWIERLEVKEVPRKEAKRKRLKDDSTKRKNQKEMPKKKRRKRNKKKEKKKQNSQHSDEL